ncbi:MAG: hypothetical protein RIR65_2367 [Planctomycetota bacterium]
MAGGPLESSPMGAHRLSEVLARIDASCAAGRLPVVVFDLDSTLFTTAPRNLKILQAYASAHGARWSGLEEVVARLSPDDMGWNIHEDLRRFGVSDERLLDEVKAFWFERFFTDEWLLVDEPVPGAPEFALACHARGALIYYLTGRHVGGMEIGTVRSLRQCGFPFWRGRCVLHLKPSFEMGDAAFKDDAVHDIRSYKGEVVATFENEPGNANMFSRAFPEALHFLLDTIHSPGAPAPDAKLVRIDDFRHA